MSVIVITAGAMPITDADDRGRRAGLTDEMETEIRGRRGLRFIFNAAQHRF